MSASDKRLNPHMREGELLLKSYVEYSLRMASRDLDPVEEMTNHELASFSNGLVTVRATDNAIYIIGTQGENALAHLDARRGVASVLAGRPPTQSITIVIDDDGHGNLVITKPDV